MEHAAAAACTPGRRRGERTARFVLRCRREGRACREPGCWLRWHETTVRRRAHAAPVAGQRERGNGQRRQRREQKRLVVTRWQASRSKIQSENVGSCWEDHAVWHGAVGVCGLCDCHVLLLTGLLYHTCSLHHLACSPHPPSHTHTHAHTHTPLSPAQLLGWALDPDADTRASQSRLPCTR